MRVIYIFTIHLQGLNRIFTIYKHVVDTAFARKKKAGAAGRKIFALKVLNRLNFVFLRKKDESVCQNGENFEII